MKESHMRTKLAHTGDLKLAKKIQSSVSVPKVLPIYMSSVFTFDDVPSLDAVYAGEADGYVYSRMTNPSTDAAEEMLAAAEGADGALVFSSGMAAIINAIIANVQAGDHIVSSPVLYGGVYDYFKHELPRFGVEVTFVEFDDPAKVEAAIRPNTKVVYTETISNPLMEVNDLPAIAGIAHAHGCNLVALGHNRDDVIETFFMSLLYESRLNTFGPVTYLDRQQVSVIRPLIFLPEKYALSVAKRLELPIRKPNCPVAGHTKREEMKDIIRYFTKLMPDADERIMNAIADTHKYGMWDRLKLPPWNDEPIGIELFKDGKGHEDTL